MTQVRLMRFSPEVFARSLRKVRTANPQGINLEIPVVIIGNRPPENGTDTEEHITERWSGFLKV